MIMFPGLSQINPGKYKEIIVDPKAKRITQLVSDAIKNRNQEHYDNIYKSKDDEPTSESENESDDDLIEQQNADRCYVEIKRLTKDNKIFRKRLIEETFK